MKQIAAIACILFCSLAVKAQEPKSVTLNVYGGYTFKDKVIIEPYYAYVNEAFQYGGGLEFFAQRNKSLELKYLRMDTHIPVYNATGSKLNPGNDKGAVNYVLIGGNNYFGSSADAKVHPYAGADLGVGWISGQNGSSAKFAWDAKLGIKIKTSSAVSLKLQAYVQSIVATFGSDYWVTGGGAVVSYPNYVTLFQFGLGGAICFDFKKK